MAEPSTPRPQASLALVRPRTWWLDRWFLPVHVPGELASELATLVARGSVVFVMRSAGLLNFLYLRWLVRRLGLPPIRVAADFRGLLGWLARVRRSRRALENALREGRSAIVFLGHSRPSDAFSTLVALQRRLDRPIFLVPVLLVWSRRAQTLKPRLWDILFGSPEAPSVLATAISFLRNHRRAFVRAGRPVELAPFVAARPSEPDVVLARKVRGALHHHLSREMRAAIGPRLKAPARVRERVLRDRTLRGALAKVAAETGQSTRALADEAERDLREIASRFSPAFVAIAVPILRWVFHRLYNGVEVDEEGLARLKRAASEAPLVLCPSHKSHIDYLILPYVLYEAGMTPPHVAAGINLAFWPFGSIARRGGAFFIRRTFKGDRIYSATLRAYVKHLLREGFPQEIYPEGGRSRSGKLLFPKTGLFSMEVDAWLEGASQDVFFVPIAIDYEKLVEARSYAQELAGGKKQKESFRALLGLPRILARRYGRIYLQFGEPISLRDLARQRLGDLAESLVPDEVQEPFVQPQAMPAQPPDPKRRLVQHLANRVAHAINRVVTLTPIGLLAAALLSQTRRGTAAEEVGRRIELLRTIATKAGGRFARELAGAPSDPRSPGVIADALADLVSGRLVNTDKAEGETYYRVLDDRRPILDFYRNNVIGHYAALSLVAAALRASGFDAPKAQVRARARWLSRLFKLEFVYRAEAGPVHPFEENVELLSELGIVDVGPEHLRCGSQKESLELLADLTRAFLESYRVAAEAVLRTEESHGDGAAGRDLDRTGMANLMMEHGRAAFLSGRIVLREALSRVTLENAVEWLIQQGALVEAADKRLVLDPVWRGSKLEDLIREIDSYLVS